MLTAEINKVNCRIAQDWSDISLSKCIQLNKIIAEMPKSLIEIYKEKGEKKENLLNQAENEGLTIKEFPIFYGKVIEILTDIDAKTLISEHRTELYHRFLLKFVIDAYHGFSTDMLMGDSFEWGDVRMDEKGFYKYEGGHYSFDEWVNNETYYFPTSEIKMGTTVPFCSESAEVFTESADLQIAAKKVAANQYDYVKNIVSILCRKKDEKYNEAEMLARTDLFENLPMSYVWRVFFYIMNASSTFIKDTANYIKDHQKELVNLLKQTSIGQRTYTR